jgi:membrane fusion protein, multidrug efflux system
MKPRWILFAVAIALLGAVLTWKFAPSASAKASPGPDHRGIPVVVANVSLSDVPIWLSGLGTVQAHNTVTMRPRVSGTLDQVNFVEGQDVQAGDVLAQIDPRPYRSALEQARAKRAQSEAQLVNAERELERVRSLFESNAESRRLLDQQEATVVQMKALVQADGAAIEAAQLDLDFTTVRSPISGRTGVRLIDAGNLVSAAQAPGLVVITQLQPISVVFTLPQQHLPALQRRLRVGGALPQVQAQADDGTVLGQGTLDLIDNLIDASTGTVRLKATFPNEDLSLWPGQFVSARVLVEMRAQALTVPAEVVQPGLNGPFAYVVQADQKVEARSLRLGPTVDGMTIIEEGLKASEQVVRDGQSKLQPGALITNTTSSAAAVR